MSDAKETAPAPFPAETLRDGIVDGERWCYRHTTPAGSWLAYTEVTDHTPDGPTFAFWTTREDGIPKEPRTEARFTWETLVGHATYPREVCTITEVTATIAAGTFEGWQYDVVADDCTTEAFFAKELAGPPVRFIKRVDGAAVFQMELLKRERP